MIYLDFLQTWKQELRSWSPQYMVELTYVSRHSSDPEYSFSNIFVNIEIFKNNWKLELLGPWEYVCVLRFWKHWCREGHPEQCQNARVQPTCNISCYVISTVFFFYFWIPVANSQGDCEDWIKIGNMHNHQACVLYIVFDD